jgi:hypothetical protein
MKEVLMRVNAFSGTVGISVSVSGVLLYLLKGKPEFAHAAAALPLFGIPHFLEGWEKYKGRRNVEERRCSSVATFDGFSVRWYFLAICGIFGVCGIMWLNGFIFDRLRELSAADVDSVVAMAAPSVVILGVLLMYLLASWIGMRSGKYGIIALVISTLVGPILSKLIDYAVLHEGDFMTGVVACFQFTIIGLVGYWRGRRRRLGRYLSYLLDILPLKTRDSFIDLAYGETCNVATAKQG